MDEDTAAGKTGTTLADDGVIALGQPLDEVVAAGLLCRFDHLLLRGIRLAEEDVRADGIVEQIHVLEHHGDVAEQTAAGELAQIVPADADRAALRVSSRGYMLGYHDLKDPSVSGFFRFLSRVGDNRMRMQIVRLEFGEQ